MHSNPLSNLCMHTWRCGDVAEGLIGRIILVLLYLLRSLDDSGPCDPVMVYLSLEAPKIACPCGLEYLQGDQECFATIYIL